MITSRFSLASFLLCSTLLIDPVKASEVGLWYTGANPDYKPFSTDYGLGITWQQALTDNTSIALLFNETDFNPSGPIVGRILVNSWAELAYRYHLDNDFYIAGSYTSADTTDGTYDGFGVHVGYNLEWSKELFSTIQFGHINTVFSDFQLEVSLNYILTNNLQVALKLRDYHEWDYTSYEAGIIYRY